MEFKTNAANWDRAARAVLGVTGIGIALAGISPWGWLGLIPLATAAIGWCPVYGICKVSTKKN
jgi:hypothetical protein